MAAPIGELEVRLLLEAIFDRYHYDFRSYAMASLKRRLVQACDTLHVGTLSGLQEKVLHEPESFSTLLQYLTVQVSDMFRDPEFFLALRTQVLPVLVLLRRDVRGIGVRPRIKEVEVRAHVQARTFAAAGTGHQCQVERSAAAVT